MLREAWGNEWKDELLVISVLDVEAPLTGWKSANKLSTIGIT